MADKLCAELVARCFAARTAAHFAHFTTGSYAEHVALNEFYDAIVDAADSFAECHMGVEGKFKSFPDVPLPKGAPLEWLPELHAWISRNRTACADGSTELANLIDEILSVIDKAFYKLKFLK